MRFSPKSEQELAAMGLLPEGEYPYHVIEAKDSISKSSGNEMIEMKIMVWDKDGREHIMFDYLLESMGHKLRHFCEANSLLNKYEAGELHGVDCTGKQGKVFIVVQPGKPNPNGGMYPDRNSVKDYAIHETLGQTVKIASSVELNDDIPF